MFNCLEFWFTTYQSTLAQQIELLIVLLKYSCTIRTVINDTAQSNHHIHYLKACMTIFLHLKPSIRKSNWNTWVQQLQKDFQRFEKAICLLSLDLNKLTPSCCVWLSKDWVDTLLYYNTTHSSLRYVHTTCRCAAIPLLLPSTTTDRFCPLVNVTLISISFSVPVIKF